MSTYLFWLKNIVMGVLSIFFLLLGVDTLRVTYSLKNPLSFLVSFFSSSLIILISLVGVLFTIVRLWGFFNSTSANKY
jgi:hypothetical protein